MARITTPRVKCDNCDFVAEEIPSGAYGAKSAWGSLDFSPGGYDEDIKLPDLCPDCSREVSKELTKVLRLRQALGWGKVMEEEERPRAENTP